MLRARHILSRSGILNPHQFISGQLPTNKLRPVNRVSSSQERCEDVPPPLECPPTKRCLMDLYPVPCGSWKEDYDANNVIYNRQLMISAGVFIVTLFVVKRVGIVKGYPEVTLF